MVSFLFISVVRSRKMESC